ncbi:MAG: hypothetical protein DRN27_09090, partial [Thermoplasmata archaeon]
LPLVLTLLDHDICVSEIDVLEQVHINSTIFVNTTICNNGLENETNIPIDFIVNGVISDSTIIDLDSMSYTELSFLWTVPDEDLDYELMIKAHPVFNETYLENNEISQMISAYASTDIIVENITWIPYNITDGDTVIFYATIKNIGNQSTYRNFDTSFFVDGEIIGTQEIQGLESGDIEIISQTWVSTPDKTTIKAHADSTHKLRETDEDNNNKTRSFEIGKSDIIITQLSWDPLSINDGDVVTFYASIENIGDTTSRLFYTRFLIDNQTIGEKYTMGLDSEETIQLCQVWSSTAGAHQITVIVDSQNQVIESSEINNKYTSNITNILMSDLVVNNITWIPPTFSNGQAVKFNATITNIGNGNTTQRFYTDFIIDNQPDCDCGGSLQYVVDGLDSGETKNISAVWAATSGFHNMTVYADLEDDVTESNEINNNVTSPLPFVTAPDLILTDITYDPTTIDDGNMVQFNITCENIGVGDTATPIGISLLIDDIVFQYDLIDPIKSGNETQWVVFKKWVAEYGQHTIKAIIDHQEMILEENEINNEFIIQVSIDDHTSPSLVQIYPENNSINSAVQQVEITLSDGYGSGVNLDESTIIILKDAQQIPGILEIEENDLIFIPNNPFNDGNYTIHTIAVDYEENINIIDTQFFIDQNAPIIEITGIVEDGYYETPVTPTIAIHDNNLLESLIEINNHDFINGTTIISEDAYEFYAYAIDNAGHETNKYINFSIDLQPLPPTAMKVIRQPTNATISWNANTEEDIAGYNIYRNEVKQNVGLILNTTYYDNGLNNTISYIYNVTAVDFAGHESDMAGVQQLHIGLQEYGIYENNQCFLTIGCADLVKINISNEEDSTIDVDEVIVEVLDSFGTVVFTSNIDSFTIDQMGYANIETQIFTTENIAKIRVIALVDTNPIQYIFDVQIRNQPEYPIEIIAPVLLEGYGDDIDILFTNYGSSTLSINPKDIKINLLDATLSSLSQGSGYNSWVTIDPQTTATIGGYIVTPMAIGEDIHLEDLSLQINISTYYGENPGDNVGMIYNYTEEVENIYQTVPAIELYHSNLIKGETALITPTFINQGTSDLTIKQGDVIVEVYDNNETLLSEGYSNNPTTTVLSGCSQFSVIQVDIPIDAPDDIILNVILNASCDISSEHADNAHFSVDTIKQSVPFEYNADASTDKDIYCTREEVIITGQVTNLNGTIMPYEGIRLKISSKGFYREYWALSDENGDYTF